MRSLSILAFAVLLPLSAQPNSELHRLFRDYYEMTLRESPESATAAGRRDYNDRWTDWSLKALAEEKQHREEYLKRLDAFRNAQLDAQDRLSFELLEYELRTSLEELNRLRNYEVVNHFFGPQLRVFSNTAMA